jgi:3-hydroxyacyl-CoA dehydrogenase
MPPAFLPKTVSSPIHTLGLIGAGVMGTAIAALNLMRRIGVVLCDNDPRALDAARGRILAELADAAHDLSAQEIDRLLVCPATYAQLANCQLVLESVVETPAIKQQVYAQVEPLLGPGTILATNTSTIPITRLATGLAQPERFCGIHFFHPACKRQLLEIIRGHETNDATAAAAVGYARQLQRAAIVAADSPGFIVNRMTSAYLAEALELLLEGAAIEEIELAATEFGMAMGPIRLLDEIGLDTVLRGGLILAEAFPDRALPPTILVKMIKSGQLGCKTGAGFYLHGPEGPLSINPSALAILQRWSAPRQQFTSQAILDRLLLGMLLEATRMIEERVVQSPGDIDVGVLFGLGFPTARGGLLRWADRLGATEILSRLRPLAVLGPRMRPPALLRSMAIAGGRFFEVGDKIDV